LRCRRHASDNDHRSGHGFRRGEQSFSRIGISEGFSVKNSPDREQAITTARGVYPMNIVTSPFEEAAEAKKIFKKVLAFYFL